MNSTVSGSGPRPNADVPHDALHGATSGACRVLARVTGIDAAPYAQVATESGFSDFRLGTTPGAMKAPINPLLNAVTKSLAVPPRLQIPFS